MEETKNITNFKIYNVYSNNMLIQQNKPFVIAGMGDEGLEITLSLKNGDQVIQTVTSISDKEDEWEATFNAVVGGYDVYNIVISVGDNVIATIENIVFGELWLASGQSNMLMNNWETPEGNEWYKNSTFPGKKLRLFTMPTTYGVECQKSEPQKELEGCNWIFGDDIRAYKFSAVAYHFGLELQKELFHKGIDVPVGIINASLGETYIESWISRDAIEDNEILKNNLSEIGKYYSKNDGWGTTLGPTTMTACYNLKIAPLVNLNIAGVIWYQGESNAELAYKKGFYTNALECLLNDWSKRFGYKDCSVPFIIAHIAPFGRTTDGMQRIWEDMSDCWQKYRDSMAQIPIYDVSLEWDYSEFTSWHNEVGNIHPIHPCNKKPVGKRMAKSAMSLVYGAEYSCTAPVYESYIINGEFIDIKFSNVCDGLKIKNSSELYGFTICGADGIYLDAKAKIISKDTVRVWNDNLSQPISVAYAYLNLPTFANLCSEYNGEPLFMAAPFRTERLNNAEYFTNQHWMTCDDEKVYHSVEMTPDLYDTWKATNASITIDKTIKYSGTGSLKINYTNNEFSVSPNIKYGDTSFRDVSCDYSNFKLLSFFVKTIDDSVTLNSVRFEIDSNFVTAQFNIKQSDKEWKQITVELDKLYNYDGSEYFGKLEVASIKFEFISAVENGTVYIDDFSFSTKKIEDMKK